MNKVVVGIFFWILSFASFALGSLAEKTRIENKLEQRCVTAIIKNVPGLSGEQLPLVRAQCEIAVRDTLE